MNSTHPCWCGQSDLTDFSPEYFCCENCQTLVLKNWPPAERFDVISDVGDFYGRGYYESHLPQAYGYPELFERARNDLNERCMHWMRTLLKYRLPPARTLELGCSHGGFVALMRWAGFDATGLELSPWLVEYAKSAFGVPMLTGTIEKQNLEPDSLDLVLHFDVLEHLPDPRTTMQRCMELLKPDGFMIVQTPCFPLAARTRKWCEIRIVFSSSLSRPSICTFSAASPSSDYSPSWERPFFILNRPFSTITTCLLS